MKYLVTAFFLVDIAMSYAVYNCNLDDILGAKFQGRQFRKFDVKGFIQEMFFKDTEEGKETLRSIGNVDDLEQISTHIFRPAAIWVDSSICCTYL